MVRRRSAIVAGLASVLVVVGVLAAPALASAPSGARLWYRVLPAGHQDDSFSQVAVAPDGAVYAAGTANEPYGALLLARYSPAGKLLWSHRYHGQAHDQGSRLAVDRFGNAIVAGCAITAAGAERLLVVKYTPGGVRAWVRRPPCGAANQNTAVAGLVVDAAGDVYLSATVPATRGKGYDCLTVAYNGHGKRLWTNRYHTAGEGSVVRAMAIDARRNIYLAGATTGSDGVLDCLTMKLSSAGRRLWLRRLEAFDPRYDCWGSALAVRGKQVVVAAQGALDATGSQFELILTAYDTAGHTRWTRYPAISEPGLTNVNVMANALALDRAGNALYAGGDGLSGPPWSAAFLGKSAAGGASLWSLLFWNRGAGLAADYAALAVDKSGNAYCGGLVDQSPTGLGDFIVAKWGADGRARWLQELQVDPAGEAACLSVALARGPTAVYGAGYAYRTGWGLDALLVKIEP